MGRSSHSIYLEVHSFITLACPRSFLLKMEYIFIFLIVDILVFGYIKLTPISFYLNLELSLGLLERFKAPRVIN